MDDKAVLTTAGGRVRRPIAEALAFQGVTAKPQDLVRQADILVHHEVSLVFNAQAHELIDVEEHDLDLGAFGGQLCKRPS